VRDPSAGEHRFGGCHRPAPHSQGVSLTFPVSAGCNTSFGVGRAHGVVTGVSTGGTERLDRRLSWPATSRSSCPLCRSTVAERPQCCHRAAWETSRRARTVSRARHASMSARDARARSPAPAQPASQPAPADSTCYSTATSWVSVPTVSPTVCEHRGGHSPPRPAARADNVMDISVPPLSRHRREHRRAAASTAAIAPTTSTWVSVGHAVGHRAEHPAAPPPRPARACRPRHGSGCPASVTVVSTAARLDPRIRADHVPGVSMPRCRSPS